MRLSRAASRYAKAILQLAVDQNTSEQVNEDMRNILATVITSRDLRVFLKSPVYKAAQKKDALKAVFAQASDQTKGLMELLVDNKRSSILGDVARSYIQQFEALNQRAIATVTTAIVLDADLEVKILAKAKALAGKEVTLEQVVDPSIIGGFVLRVGDKEINASVVNQFDGLQQALA